MTARPSAQQLAEYVECLEAGIDPETARTEVWDETAPVLRQMITEFPDGIAIGWSTCAVPNGGCGKHVRHCTCANGPREPKIFEKWRLEPPHLLTRADSAPAESAPVG